MEFIHSNLLKYKTVNKSDTNLVSEIESALSSSLCK